MSRREFWVAYVEDGIVFVQRGQYQETGEVIKCLPDTTCELYEDREGASELVLHSVHSTLAEAINEANTLT